MATLLHCPNVSLAYRATAIVNGMTREQIVHTLGKAPCYVETGKYRQLIVLRDKRTTVRVVLHEGLAVAVQQYHSK